MKNFYDAADVDGLNYARDLNNPGDFPFTRGIKKRTRGSWIQRELSGEGSPGTSNRQLKYLIENGQTGIDIIGDSPTMAMMDPDHPLAKYSCGTQGVSLCCLQDYRELFHGLPLRSVSISSSVPAIFAVSGLYLTAQENGVPTDHLKGSVLQPTFYAEDCGYAVDLPVELRIRLSLDTMEFATKEMPNFRSYVEDTYFFSETALTPTEEMALGFIEIKYLVGEMIKRGVDVDSFAKNIVILVNCGLSFFDEVAKIRATRRIFAHLMRDEFHAKNPKSLAAIITAHTSGLSLTAQQPVNNIIRGAIQGMALAVAGVQAMEISGFDEAFRTPTPESHLVGLRTQQIIQSEANIGKVMDPLGGSYYVESLTNEMEKNILSLMREIEGKGTPVELSHRGWFKDFFQSSMLRYQRQLSERTLVRIGLNAHQIDEDKDTLLRDVAHSKIEPCFDHIEKIAAFKRRRDLPALRRSLQRVRDAAGDRKTNLVSPVLEALKADATAGEITGVLRMAYGLAYDPRGAVEPIL